METNFVEVAKKAVDEIHEMNVDTVRDFGGGLAECFPAYVSRRIEIDGEEYGLGIEFSVRKLK